MGQKVSPRAQNGLKKRICILVELVDTRLSVELDVRRITVAGILHLMSGGAVTGGGPSSK